MDMAQITIIGRLTGDPVLKTIREGKQVTEFRVAVNHRFRNDNGWQEREPSYFNVECWDRMAENASFSLKKGTPVVVVGRAEQSTWIAELEDGTQEKRVKHRINAQSVAPHLGERVAKVQFDLTRSKKLEEEMEQANREGDAQQSDSNGLGMTSRRDTDGTDALRRSLSASSEDNRDKGLVGVGAGLVPEGEDAKLPDGFPED